jgi:hypothetical protein
MSPASEWLPISSAARLPVEITMKVTTKYADTMNTGCQAELATAGVLGEVYLNLDCRASQGGRC